MGMSEFYILFGLLIYLVVSDVVKSLIDEYALGNIARDVGKLLKYNDELCEVQQALKDMTDKSNEEHRKYEDLKEETAKHSEAFLNNLFKGR